MAILIDCRLIKRKQTGMTNKRSRGPLNSRLLRRIFDCRDLLFSHSAILAAGSWRSGGHPGIFFYLLLILFITPLQAQSSPVAVPIELDYPLLRQLLIRQLFSSPQQSAEILNDPSGCSRILLSNPQLAEKQTNLKITTEVKARLGVNVLGSCTELLQWQGSAVFLGQPVMQPGATSIRFEPVDSWLIAADGGKITSGSVWDLAKEHFYPLYSRFTLDLTPSVNRVGLMLPDVLPYRSTQQLQMIVDSMALRDLRVSPGGINLSLSFQVDELPQQTQFESALPPQELQAWEARWQMMDALFTFAVKFYASRTKLQELNSRLMEILLDSRYRLRDALTTPASRFNDPVRGWFLESWKSLRPLIRSIALEQTGQDSLLWISLLTATDALYALDRLGPAIGLDISTDGLRRLARLINENAGIDPLSYSQDVDPELQQLFFPPPTIEPEQPSGYRFDPWPIRSAWAGRSTGQLDRWMPDKDQLGEYLSLVANLLKETAERTLKDTGLEPAVSGLFQKLLLATAWQESCWRQYVVNSGRIEPLRSGTGDVGLMQINEKVWRGFYDIQKLRWDIAYNSRAGAEILHNYLVKYALKKGEHKRSGGIDNLARASYSAYNGGPSQITRYRTSNAAPTHKKVDTAFWKKYRQVKAGNELNVAQCLGGEATGSTITPPTTNSAKKSAHDKKRKAAAKVASGDAGEILAPTQHEDRFTLQLGVFSMRDSAQKFIAQQSLSGKALLYPVRKGKTTQFAVLYGSYAKRSDADRAKKQFMRFKPWVRRFREIR